MDDDLLVDVVSLCGESHVELVLFVEELNMILSLAPVPLACRICAILDLSNVGVAVTCTNSITKIL